MNQLKNIFKYLILTLTFIVLLFSLYKVFNQSNNKFDNLSFDDNFWLSPNNINVTDIFQSTELESNDIQIIEKNDRIILAIEGTDKRNTTLVPYEEFILSEEDITNLRIDIIDKEKKELIENSISIHELLAGKTEEDKFSIYFQKDLQSDDEKIIYIRVLR